MIIGMSCYHKRRPGSSQYLNFSKDLKQQSKLSGKIYPKGMLKKNLAQLKPLWDTG